MGSLMDLIVYHENKPYLAYLNPQMALPLQPIPIKIEVNRQLLINLHKN